MGDHYTLDVNVDDLRAGQRWLGTLSEHVKTEGGKISSAPDSLGSWKGDAATKITGEMESLGSTVSGFETKLTTLRDAVKTFADAVEDFQDTTLATYNRKWREANDDAEQKMQAADDAEDGRTSDGMTRGDVASGLRYTLQGLDAQFAEEKKALTTKAQTLGEALGASSPVDVPDSVASRFVSGGGSGHNLSWTDDDGDFPPDLDANGQLEGTSLSEDVDQTEAGEDIAEQVNDGSVLVENARRSIVQVVDSFDEISRRVRQDARIAPSPGPEFGPGGETFLRFNLATQRYRVEDAVSRLQTAFADLQ